MSLILVVALMTIGLSFIPLGAKSAFAGTDDYPSPWRSPTPADTRVDNWGYWNRECTSFVAWRLHSRNGFEMPRAIGGAGSWGSWAQGHGYSVNMLPVVGAVAWWSSGHVAWVKAVNGNNVTIEEYNFDAGQGPHNYWERTVLANSVSGYIHFKDIIVMPTPAPSLPADSDNDGVLDNQDSCPFDYGYSSWSWWTGCPDGRYSTPYKITGDFNGDGKVDIAVAARSGYPGINLWVFNGSNMTAPAFQFSLSNRYWEGVKIIAGDFNGDTYDDAAILYKTGDVTASLAISYGSSSGLSAPIHIWEDSWAWQNLKPIVGDFNGDGKSDVAMLARCGVTCSNLFVFRGESAGLGSPFLIWTDNWAWENVKPTAGDFNGDGKSDVAMLTRCGVTCSNLFVLNGANTGLSSPNFSWNNNWAWSNLLLS